MQTVATLYNNPRSTEESMLHSLVTSAEEGRACYGERSVRRVIWLLNNEVWALDHLAHYAEADSLTDLFFDRYYEAASPEYRARFAAWRVHFASLRGDYTTAAFTIGETTAFMNALPVSRQINLRLDLAYLYEQDGEFSRSLAIIDSIETVHGVRLQADSSLRTTYARVLLEGARPINQPIRRSLPLMPSRPGGAITAGHATAMRRRC